MSLCVFALWVSQCLCLYICIDETHLAAIVEASKHATVVYIPTHKSHLDYLIVSYLTFLYGNPYDATKP